MARSIFYRRNEELNYDITDPVEGKQILGISFEIMHRFQVFQKLRAMPFRRCWENKVISAQSYTIIPYSEN